MRFSDYSYANEMSSTKTTVSWRSQMRSYRGLYALLPDYSIARRLPLLRHHIMSVWVRTKEKDTALGPD